ncbi:MAG: GntR family transcriptional regulator [Chloroflexi bacterium]|nr:GntR family transcriptional regulator [Chloroflexota bacterium]
MLISQQAQPGVNGGADPRAAGLAQPSGEVAVVSIGNGARSDTAKPVFSPTRSGVLRQEVTLAIEQAILLGAIAPGQRLVEADVANQMGISKAPVREALRSLEQLGLVVNRPRRGTFVTPVTATLAGEAFSLRALLETYAARLAVHTVEESHLTRMRQYLEHAADVWDDYPARIDYDLKMHDVIFELSGHKLLQQAWGNLRSQVQLLLTVSGILRSEEYGRGQPRSMVTVHESIMTALRERDADRLEAEIVAHLAEGERRLRLMMDPLGSEPYVRQELFTRRTERSDETTGSDAAP